MSGGAVIQIANLQVVFKGNGRTSQTAVKGLNLAVHAGETFGFLGPNGAGKTTTMNVLLGFVRPTSGTARVFNVDVGKSIARQRIGYLPEQTYYYRFLSAEEILAFYARIFQLPRQLARQRIDAVLKLVDLESARKRQLRTYSKGMQQRVGLAQALINDPDLLILDEPTSGLDPVGRMQIRDIIRRLKQEGKTVFFSSHELGEVETVCDRVAIMQNGELRATGTIAELTRGKENLEAFFLETIGYRGAGA
jgi:ABC-2 type transport system ATP-binding protein